MIVVQNLAKKVMIWKSRWQQCPYYYRVSGERYRTTMVSCFIVMVISYLHLQCSVPPGQEVANLSVFSHKWCSIAHSLFLSASYRPDMTKILLKRTYNGQSSIQPSQNCFKLSVALRVYMVQLLWGTCSKHALQAFALWWRCSSYFPVVNVTLKAQNKKLQQTTFYFFTFIFQRK